MVRRDVRTGTAACADRSFGAKHVVPLASSGRALAVSFSGEVQWCDFDHARSAAVAIDGHAEAAWVDGAAPPSWLVTTREAALWRVDAGGAAYRLPSAAISAAIQRDGTIAWAVGGDRGRLMLGAGSQLYVGSVAGDRVELSRIRTAAKPQFVRFAPRGDRFAVATEDGIVSIYGRAEPAPQLSLDHRIVYYIRDVDTKGRSELATTPVTDCAWSPDGRRLATLQPGFGVRIWETSADRASEPRVLRGHAGASVLRWAPDGAALATFGDDGDVYVWAVSVGPPQQAAILDRLTTAAAVDASSGALALGAVAGTVHVLGQLALPPLALAPPRRCGEPRSSIAVHWIHAGPAADKLWVAHADGLIARWQRRGDAYQVVRADCTTGTVFGYSPYLAGAVFVDASHRLAIADDTGVRLIDAAPATEDIVAFQVSADGRWAVGGSRSGWIVRWDLWRAPIAHGELRSHRDAVTCLSIDAATGAVFSTSEDGTAAWTALDGHTTVWRGDGGWLESCATSPGRAVMASEAGRLWSLAPPSPAELPFVARSDVAHAGSIAAISIDPLGDRLITGGGIDGEVRVWSQATQRMLANAQLDSAVVAIVPDPARHAVYAVSEGGQVRWLPLDVAALQAALRARTSAELTPAERTDSLGESPDAAYAGYARRETARGRSAVPRNSLFDMPF